MMKHPTIALLISACTTACTLEEISDLDKLKTQYPEAIEICAKFNNCQTEKYSTESQCLIRESDFIQKNPCQNEHLALLKAETKVSCSDVERYESGSSMPEELKELSESYTQCTMNSGMTACSSDADCLNGQTCMDKVCIKLTNQCQTSKDCASDQVCENLKCVKKPDETGCSSDFDCKNGQVCENSMCVAKSSKTECSSDSDCKNGQVCENSRCVEKSSEIECSSNADCKNGQVCENSMCVEKSSEIECSSNADCKNGQVCENSMCVAKSGEIECSSNADCKTGYLCANGQCIADVCSDITCSGHGECVVTSENKPQCNCEPEYKNDGNTSCVSIYGASGGHAYPSEKEDPWGLVWDSQQRAAKNLKEAMANCQSMGGRLPTPTEIRRNNATDGEAGLATLADSDFIWSDTRIWSGNYEAFRLSDGKEQTSLYSTSLPYRCVWDPEPRPITLSGVNCHGHSYEDGCVTIQVVGHRYTVDRRNRPIQIWIQAAEECRLAGGRLPTNHELIMLIQNGLPNGTNEFIWSYSNVGDSKISAHRWNGTGNSAYTYLENMTNATWSSRLKFRCISEEVSLENGKPVFPQTKAENAFVVDPLLRIDRNPRMGTSIVNAYSNCMNDGGHLAGVDELTLAVRQGLDIGANWYATSTSIGAENWFVRGNSNYTAPYYDMSDNLNHADFSKIAPYFCAYRPNRVFDQSDFEKKAADGIAWQYTQSFDSSHVIYHFVREKSENTSSYANNILNEVAASNKGMYIPSDSELLFLIQQGLPGGGSNAVFTSSANGWLYYRAFKWSGIGNSSFTPSSSNFGTLKYNNNASGFRSYISSVMR